MVMCRSYPADEPRAIPTCGAETARVEKANANPKLTHPGEGGAGAACRCADAGGFLGSRNKQRTSFV